MPATKVQHCRKARMPVIPFAQLAGGEVILVIFFQFLYAGPRHIDELDFHFGGADTIGTAFHNILLARACRLHHLVHCTVTAFQKPLGKGECQQIKNIRLFVEEQVLIIGLAAKEMNHSVLFCFLSFFFRFSSSPSFSSISRVTMVPNLFYSNTPPYSPPPSILI